MVDELVVKLKRAALSKKAALAALSILAAGMVYLLLPADCPEAARRTAFVFVFAALFWAFEIIPLYATSLLVVLLQTFLLCRPGGVLGMDEGGYVIFLLPFASPVIMLFFGGFILAVTLHKYHVDALIANRLLKLFGGKPYFIMLGFMLATAFLSMWMSNTATAAMMLVMIRPLLDRIDKNDLFKTALVLSIPFGANIGGIGTPIGTPPNAIALGILADHGIRLNFLSWMMMAVPLALIILAITSFILFAMFPPKHSRVRLEISDPYQDGISLRAKGAMLVAVITVFLWLSSGWHHIPEALVALVSVGLFTALGFIHKKDFNSINWDVLVLMWGGLALGKAMEVSGFTKWIVALPIFAQHGFVLVALFCMTAILLSTFMSNTAAANLLIPIVISIPGESSIMLAVMIALSTSFAMALPISTPPNAMAFATDQISGRDMLKSGALITVLSFALILAGFRYVIPRVFGF